MSDDSSSTTRIALKAARTRSGVRDLLRGDLSESNLAEVLQFLLTLRKDGQVLMEQDEPRLAGGIYLAGGDVTHAVCPPYHGMEALVQLLNWHQGRYAFIANVASQERTLSGSFQSVMLEAMRILDERSRHWVGLPTPTTILHRERDPRIFARSPLDLRAWRLLELVDGQRSIQEVYELAGSTGNVAALLRQMLMAGVLRTHPDSIWMATIRFQRLDASARQHRPAAPLSLAACHILRGCDDRATMGSLAVATGLNGEVFIRAVRELVEGYWIELVEGEEVYRDRIGVPDELL